MGSLSIPSSRSGGTPETPSIQQKWKIHLDSLLSILTGAAISGNDENMADGLMKVLENTQELNRLRVLGGRDEEMKTYIIERIRESRQTAQYKDIVHRIRAKTEEIMSVHEEQLPRQQAMTLVKTALDSLEIIPNDGLQKALSPLITDLTDEIEMEQKLMKKKKTRPSPAATPVSATPIPSFSPALPPNVQRIEQAKDVLKLQEARKKELSVSRYLDNLYHWIEANGSNFGNPDSSIYWKRAVSILVKDTLVDLCSAPETAKKLQNILDNDAHGLIVLRIGKTLQKTETATAFDSIVQRLPADKKSSANDIFSVFRISQKKSHMIADALELLMAAHDASRITLNSTERTV